MAMRCLASPGGHAAPCDSLAATPARPAEAVFHSRRLVEAVQESFAPPSRTVLTLASVLNMASSVPGRGSREPAIPTPSPLPPSQGPPGQAAEGPRRRHRTVPMPALQSRHRHGSDRPLPRTHQLASWARVLRLPGTVHQDIALHKGLAKRRSAVESVLQARRVRNGHLLGRRN